jgi:hypothetical protein
MWSISLFATIALFCCLIVIQAQTPAAPTERHDYGSVDEKIALITIQVERLIKAINSDEEVVKRERDGLKRFATPKQLEISREVREKFYSSEKYFGELQQWKQTLDRRLSSLREERRALIKLLGLPADDE